MTDREAMQQALEALEAIRRSVQSDYQAEIAEDAITALREALAQPEQEPVAWAVQACSKMWRGDFAEIDAKAEAKRIGGTCVAFPLYTAPPQRPWVGLTDGEKVGLARKHIKEGWGLFYEAIEARLKEVNK